VLHGAEVGAVLFVVLLMIVLGKVKRLGFSNFRYDLVSQLLLFGIQ